MTATAPTAVPAAAAPATLAAQVGAALLVLVLAQTGDTPAPGQGLDTLLMPASGAALALVLCAGPSLLPGLGAGWLLAYALAGNTPAHALAHTLGHLAALWVAGHWLRTRSPFKPDQPHFGVLHHLLLGACVLGAGAGALLASALHWLAGGAGADCCGQHLAQAWMGNALSFMLVTPLALSYRRALRQPEPLTRLREGLLAWLLAAVAGTIIFGGAPTPWLAPLANAYWMFLFIGWSGMRLGMLFTMCLLGLIALQALWGSYQGLGFFGRDIATTWGFGYWSYMMILCVMGLALSSYMAERRRQRTALRIAATAFDSQEALLITDARGHILQANQALLRLTGFAAGALLGRTPALLRSQAQGGGRDEVRDGARDGDAAPVHWFTPAAHVQHRLTLARSDGSSFAAWVRVSPVHGAQGAASHYVLALTDISDYEAQEAARRQAEAAQRNALVREVHHRIKNNLQSIIGMLRQLDRQHPQLREAIRRTIAQVHAIATVHGLQGGGAGEAIALHTLIGAVVQGTAQQWDTAVQLPPTAQGPHWQLAASECVPVALVLGELMVNALKHGGQAHQDVQLHWHSNARQVSLSISNPVSGPAPEGEGAALPAGHGLDLVRRLLPRQGARLSHQRRDGRMLAQLTLTAPVIQPRNGS